MKNIFYVALFFATTVLAEPFEILNNKYPLLTENPQNYTEKELSFEGTVLSVTNSNINTPYIELALSGQSESKLWSAMLFNLGKGKGIEKGNLIRVYGFYASLESGEKPIGGNNTGHHLLTFCVANLSTNEKFYFPRGIEQCKDWEDGNN